MTTISSTGHMYKDGDPSHSQSSLRPQPPVNVLLTAGGTGGHVFPALALAEILSGRGYRVCLVTDRRGRQFESDQYEFDVKTLNILSPSGRLITKTKSAVTMLGGYYSSRRLLASLRPAVVVGFGGYPSFPVMLAAQHMKIKNIIHEQNAVIGKANLMMARRADRIATSLPRITGLTSEESRKTVFTGNPVREKIQELHKLPYVPSAQGQAFNILVLGGSQGASIFSEVIPQALARLPAHQRARLRVVQQCRQEDLHNTEAAYRAAGIPAEAQIFFSDIPTRLQNAHLVISRSGASTVAEVTTAGRPAIFVPYPWHKDQQQKMNADVVADYGGAWVMAQNGFTQDALLARLLTFLQDPETLENAARAAQECAFPQAATRLADLVEEMVAVGARLER